MIKRILDAVNFRRAKTAVARNPILRAGLLKSSVAFDATGLKDFSEETKRKMAADLIEVINEIANCQNKLERCRYHFAASVLELGRYQVLILPPFPEFDGTGLRGTQGVSGELKPLLLDICEKNVDMHKMMYDLVKEPAYNDVWDVVLFRYWKNWWWAETINACRIEIGDFNPIEENDWYRPFVHAACVWSEYEFRHDLGMPPGPKISEESLVPLQYSTFVDFVLSGEKFPDLAWRSHYRRSIEDATLDPPN